MIQHKINTCLRKAPLGLFALAIIAGLFFIIKGNNTCNCENENHRDKIATIFIALTTLYFASQNLRRDNDRFTKELFKEFNKRYDKMNEFLNAIDDADIDNTGSANFRNKIYDYLNLCAEEYYWYYKGHIPDLIWKNWEEGILWHLKKKKVKEIFDEELASDNNRKSYYGFLKYMKTLLKQ